MSISIKSFDFVLQYICIFLYLFFFCDGIPSTISLCSFSRDYFNSVLYLFNTFYKYSIEIQYSQQQVLVAIETLAYILILNFHHHRLQQFPQIHTVESTNHSISPPISIVAKVSILILSTRIIRISHSNCVFCNWVVYYMMMITDLLIHFCSYLRLYFHPKTRP